MFGFGKKKSPLEALEHSEKTMTTGLSGMFYKTVMGKENHDVLNESFAKIRDAVEKSEAYKRGDFPGSLPATAEVVSIHDSGMMVNYNPVVVMQLKVQPESEAPFETTAGTMVSKIAVPRVGDIINIKYDPIDRSHIVVIQ